MKVFPYPIARGGKCAACGAAIPEGADTYAAAHHVYCSLPCVAEGVSK